MSRTTLILLAWLAVVTAVAPLAAAVKIADITRLGGQRSDKLVGYGLVVGLSGTGDGGDYMPAMKPLTTLLSKLGDSTTVRELGASQNVALVVVTATLPKDGVREGDRIDVHVQSVGAAASLKGGRLFVTPLQGPLADPNGEILALAEGPVAIQDPANLRGGVVTGGAVMEADWYRNDIENGRFSLVLDDASASWTTASTIAKTINGAEGSDGETLAVVVDAKSVLVSIPAIERERPDSFISRVQELPVLIRPTEAQVRINRATGTMIITGDVEISPVVISHKGLVILTPNPPPVPTPRNPVVTARDMIALDTTGQGGAKLQDLVKALDVLKVPAEDRITIIEQLYKTGKLHAKLIVE